MKVSNNIQTVSKISNPPLITSQPSFKGYTHFPKDIFTSSMTKKQGLLKSFLGAIGLGSIIKANEAKSQKELEKIFQELYDFKGDNVDFAKLAFKKIKTYLGLEEILDKDLISRNIPTHPGCLPTSAGFDWRKCEFVINEEGCKSETKDSILCSISHELEHYLQYEKIMRFKKIGVDKFAELYAQFEMAIYKQDFFEANLNELLSKEGEEYLLNTMQGTINKEVWKDIVNKRGIIKSKSGLQQAQQYLEAHFAYPNYDNYARNYLDYMKEPYDTSYDFFKDLYKTEKAELKYYTNKLEMEAKKAGANIQDAYLKFVSKATGEPFIKNSDQEDFDKLNIPRMTAIKDFDEIFEQKFGKYNLPENFKAFIYAQIKIECNLNAQDGLSLLKLVPQRMKEIDKNFMLKRTQMYEYLLNEGIVNLRSQDEIDRFNRFIQEYKAEIA